MPEEQQQQQQQQEEQTKLKEVGVHKVKIEKYLSEDGEELICKVGLNDSLKDLLSTFIVKGQFSTEEYEGMKIKRFKIKSVLRNSHSWNNAFSHFFSKECIEEGGCKISFNNVNAFQNFISSLRYFRDMIRLMEELKREETMTVSYKLER